MPTPTWRHRRAALPNPIASAASTASPMTTANGHHYMRARMYRPILGDSSAWTRHPRRPDVAQKFESVRVCQRQSN